MPGGPGGLQPGFPGVGPGAGGPGSVYLKSPAMGGGGMIPGENPMPSPNTPISQFPASPYHSGRKSGRESPYSQHGYGDRGDRGGMPGMPGMAMIPGAGGMMGGGGGMGGMPPRSPGGQSIAGYSAAQAFARPPAQGLTYGPFKAFPIFNDMDELYDMLPDVPPLPAALVDHDVQFNDWARWMTVSPFFFIRFSYGLDAVSDRSWCGSVC